MTCDPAAARNRPGTERYWATLTPRPHGSYCCSATCLAHKDRVYVNMQEWAWVHTTGWPCDGLAALTAVMQAGHAAELAARFGRSRGPRRRPDPSIPLNPPAWQDGALFTREELTSAGE